jgi:outer membrane protein assembly factor BamB
MPAADSSGVAFTSALSRLILLDGSGAMSWVAERPRLRDVAPRLTPDLVVAATEYGLAGFRRDVGAAAWSADIGERTNTPVLADGVLVASTWDGSLVGVDERTGALRWRSPLPGSALGPAATDGRLAVTTWVADDHGAAGAVAVEAATGAPRWQVSLPPGGVSAPGVNPATGQVVVVAGDVAAHGLDLATGVEVWRTDLEGAGSPEVPPLAVADGDVLVGHRLGGMVLLDSHGRPRWQVSSDGAAVRGGLAGPGPGGRFAFPLDDGRLLLAGPGAPSSVLDPPGRVSGVAMGPDGTLGVGTRDASDNGVTASSGW